MTRLLLDNPLLLLFVVVAIGYPAGRIKFRGTSLGVATVLFAGLAIGGLDRDLKLPAIIYQLGLVLFVYTVGLSSGRAFFDSFRRQGIRNALLVVGIVSLGTAISVVSYFLLNLKPTPTAGMFAGSMTNTPALAAELEYLQSHASASLEQMLVEPVVGYSVAYPVGVIGVIVAIALVQRTWQIDYRAEACCAQDVSETSQQLQNLTIRVTQSEATTRPIRALIEEHGWRVVFGRIQRDGHLEVASGKTVLKLEDLVSIVGDANELPGISSFLGESVDQHLELNRNELDFRRIFVSAPAVSGHRLSDLNLAERFGAVVTRIRRGDVEFLPDGKTMLAPGDRVRVVAPRTVMPAVTTFFGDTPRHDILDTCLQSPVSVMASRSVRPLKSASLSRIPSVPYESRYVPTTAGRAN